MPSDNSWTIINDQVIVQGTSSPDDAQPPDFTFTKYNGPVPDVDHELAVITPDNLNIMGLKPNLFIHSGKGEDAINVSHSNGTNVLDGATGSNFLTGGTGTDQFYVDDRNPSGDIWSTLQNFHSGDSATIWGLNPNDFTIDLLNGQGAIGAQGLTFSATADGQPNANLTIAGYSMSDVNSGKLDVSFGHSPDTGGVSGSDYMMIKAV